MAIIKCEQGHFYDSIKYKKCPFCNKAEMDIPETVWQVSDPSGKIQKVSVVNSRRAVDEEITIGVFSPKKGNDYVVGWLVCIKGPDKGRDYRLHQGFNRVGRDYGNDVVLENDRMVSRNSHCSVIYEDKTNYFYICPEEGTITYLKGEFLQEPVRLYSHDVIELGGSLLEFVAFCEGSRTWER